MYILPDGRYMGPITYLLKTRKFLKFKSYKSGIKKEKIGKEKNIIYVSDQSLSV